MDPKGPARLVSYDSDPETTLRIADDRWELGSAFHLSLEAGVANYPWSAHPNGLWGSGRDALRALLAWGRVTWGWRRLLVPTYLCQVVPAAAQRVIEVSAYESAPTESSTTPVETRDGDVVLAVATFGLLPPLEVSERATVIEDHSHDPLASHALESRANYAIASLRKTLPLPDGGVAWSPRDLPLPSEAPATSAHAFTTLQRLSAMTLKRDYLAGHDVVKADFLTTLTQSERAIGAGEISGISRFSRSRLPTMPTTRWREARAGNLRAFEEALGTVPGVDVLDAPFAAVLVFEESALRQRLADALIRERVYATVHWPLDAPVVAGIPQAHRDLASRILSIHCDYRYAPQDMVRVAHLVREAVAEA